jgi:hypothetical protein
MQIYKFVPENLRHPINVPSVRPKTVVHRCEIYPSKYFSFPKINLLFLTSHSSVHQMRTVKRMNEIWWKRGFLFDFAHWDILGILVDPNMLYQSLDDVRFSFAAVRLHHRQPIYYFFGDWKIFTLVESRN